MQSHKYPPHRRVDPPAGNQVDSRVPLTGAKPRVLVVDDNEDVGMIATEMLQDLGYVTTRVYSGRQALELLRAGKGFDLLFTDVMMPGMNGIELADRVRQTYPELPVVLTSGYSDVLAQTGTGGLTLVRKPYSLEDLDRAMNFEMTKLLQKRMSS